MVNRRDRDGLALLLRRLAAGRISNDEFDMSAPWQSLDQGVDAVLWTAWTLYSDLRTHRLVGPDALSSADRRHVARAVVFLHSDVEYGWPKWPIPYVLRDLGALLTGGRVESSQKRRAAWMARGDFAVWPFLNRADYDQARFAPRFFRATGAPAA